LRGHSVMPGIVGMHGHLYYFAFPNITADFSFERPAIIKEMTFSAPRMYLANGVTTMRTAGTYDPYADIELRSDIEKGTVPGPHLDVTGRYLQGGGDPAHPNGFLTGPEDTRQTVAFWADRGITSFKAYSKITRAELRAAIEEAHKRGLKVTGHLCSVGYREAAEIGIDNLEHGLLPDSEFVPNKQPDKCPGAAVNASLRQLDLNSDAVKQTIHTL